MRVFCLVVLTGCVSTPVITKAEPLPDGWTVCAGNDRPATPCLGGHAGCEALKDALQRCGDRDVGPLLVRVDTDDKGAVTRQCLTAQPQPTPAPALKCVSDALARIGAVLPPQLHGAPLQLTIFRQRVSVWDGRGMTADIFMGTMLSALPQLGRCVERQHRLAPRETGKVVMAWNIAADGSVDNVELRSREHEGTELGACLTGVVAAIQFPAHEQASPEPVVFPIKY